MVFKVLETLWRASKSCVLSAESFEVNQTKWEENNIKRVAVAVAEEAIFLRQHEVTMPIIVLNELLEGEAEKAVAYDLTPGISVYEVAVKLNEFAKEKGKTIKVHVEVDTRNGKSRPNSRKHARFY